jgi:hypothetical protein
MSMAMHLPPKSDQQAFEVATAAHHSAGSDENVVAFDPALRRTKPRLRARSRSDVAPGISSGGPENLTVLFASLKRGSMPLYFFHAIKGDRKYSCQEGEHHPCDANAMHEAELVAQELAHKSGLFKRFEIVVTDESGQEVGRAPVESPRYSGA